MMALNLIGGNPRLLDDLLRTGSCDTSYTLIEKARFRVNIFSQRGNYSIVLRKLNTKIATLSDLGLPEILHMPAREKTGLVLVTGATGSGKSTTLAAEPMRSTGPNRPHRHPEDPSSSLTRKRVPRSTSESGVGLMISPAACGVACQAPKIFSSAKCAIGPR
jgi:hypothetical protein